MVLRPRNSTQDGCRLGGGGQVVLFREKKKVCIKIGAWGGGIRKKEV